jgi:hypothetical protein
MPKILIGLTLLVCLGVGETWLYAANSLGRHMHQQTFGGASLADFCASSDVGGFPFRLRMTCSRFSAPVRTAQGDILAKADEARGEASIFAPNHIVLTLSSPIVLLRPDGGPLAKLRHDGMTLDIAWTGSGLDKADLDIHALDWRPEAPEAGIAFNMQEVRAQEQLLQGDALHFDLAGDGVTAPLVQQWLQKSDLGHFTASGRITPAPRLTGNWRAAIEDWRQKSGAVAIDSFDWRAGDLSLQLDGALALDDSHRALGKLKFSASGAGPILTSMGIPASAAQVQNVIGALLGRPATTSTAGGGGDRIAMPLVMANGQVSLGPLRLPVVLAPLY